ncbi:unnamed protein product [Prorocentrum cordatum]|uniref:Uncharacterized protein n=1 Tax=Prorocentrum cordatum TaxID=2364126 RepID=A0ABN9U0J0_9DINO|nr:unnamed protein product [Polarella glacialis]
MARACAAAALRLLVPSSCCPAPGRFNIPSWTGERCSRLQDYSGRTLMASDGHEETQTGILTGAEPRGSHRRGGPVHFCRALGARCPARARHVLSIRSIGTKKMCAPSCGGAGPAGKIQARRGARTPLAHAEAQQGRSWRPPAFPPPPPSFADSPGAPARAGEEEEEEEEEEADEPARSGQPVAVRHGLAPGAQAGCAPAGETERRTGSVGPISRAGLGTMLLLCFAISEYF